ncbi:MAG TPA: amino acid ABC transporter permease [Acidimicrobiales bacterium]
MTFLGNRGRDDPTAPVTRGVPNLLASRRSQLFTGKRGVAASAISSIVILGAIVALLYVAPGGATVRFTYFNLHDMWQAWQGDPTKGIEAIRDGIVANIWMFLLSEVLVLFLGLMVAWCRITTSPVLFPFRVLATAYTDVFRGVPVLLVVLLVGYGLPALEFGVLSSQSLDVYGVIALTLSYTAYVSEVFRAGIYSIPSSQTHAAQSLGLSNASTMRRVILPQAVRNVIPPLLNDFISLQKDTALVSVLGAVEATRAAQIYASTVFNESGLTVAALFFLVLTIPMTRFTDRLIAKDRGRRLVIAS